MFVIFFILSLLWITSESSQSSESKEKDEIFADNNNKIIMPTNNSNNKHRSIQLIVISAMMNRVSGLVTSSGASRTLSATFRRDTGAGGRAFLRRKRTSTSIQSFSAAASSSSSLSELWKESAFIDGKWISVEDHATNSGGGSFDVYDPASENTVIATLPDMTSEDTTRAITAAQTAFDDPVYSTMLAKERSQLLRDLALLSKDHEVELGTILAMESGKPLAEAIGEIRYGAGYFEWYAEEAKRIDGTIIPEPVAGRKIFAMKEPVGVTALITPWNFPNAMIARKLAPVLASGCTAVIKPSQDTPLSTLAIVALLHDTIGLPDGVVNVVTGGYERTPEIGTALTQDDRVRKISFTGSTRVGQHLMEQSAKSVKKLSMELGGDAPFIVFEDATNLQDAVQGLMMSKFRNAGQTCVASNRIFVQRSIYEEFVQLLTETITTDLIVGRYDDPTVTMGPLINGPAVDKVDGIVQDAVAAGATVVTGGTRLSSLPGHFYAPTVLTDCTDTMRVANEEIFGPVIPIFCFETEEEVVQRANATSAGLASYFYTSNLSRIFRISKALQYGMIGCNTGMISDAVVPFGGIKHSGLGREGSKFGLDDYMHIKTVTLQHD